MTRPVTLPLLLLVAACTSACPGPARPPAVAPTPAVSASHGREAVALRDAVVMGDLDSFHRAAEVLAQRFPLPGAGHETEQAALLTRVGQARTAADLPAAARAVGDLGLACADCHRAAGVHPVAAPESTPTGDGVRAEMARHDAALQDLWMGVVADDAAARTAAAARFQRSFLSPQGAPPGAATTELDEQVTAWANAVAVADTPDRRAAAFAVLLQACASCHRAPPEGLRGEPE